MGSISTIGLDIAKSVFQAHAINEAGQVVVRRQLKPRTGAAVLCRAEAARGRLMLGGRPLPDCAALFGDRA